MQANFSIDFIKILSNSVDEYNKGLEIFENFGTLDTIETMEENEPTDKKLKQYDITILDFDEKKYFVKLKTDMRGNLTFDNCSCGESGCRHFVCAMMNFVKNETSGLKSVQIQNAKKVLSDTFKNNFTDSITIDEEKIKIFPYINFSSKEIMFKVGRKQNYVIKDLVEFLRLIQENEYYVYGAKLEFRHTEKSFSKIANKYVDLIHSELEDTLKKGTQETKRSLSLKMFNIDRFFDLFKETKIFVSDTGRDIDTYTQGICIEDEIPVQFEVLVQSVESKILRPDKNFRTIVGIDNTYILIDNKIFKVQKKAGELLSAMYSTMRILKTSEINYALSELDDFLSYIYPSLKKYNLVSNPIELDSVDLLQPKTSIYLDVDKGNINAILKIMYSREKGFRDRLKESEIKSEFRKYHFLRSKDIERETLLEKETLFEVEKISFRLKDSENIFFFLLQGVNTLKTITEVFISNEIKNYMNSIKYPKPKIDFKMSSGEFYKVKLIDVGVVSEDFEPDEIKSILESFKTNKKFHRLKNDLFLDLEHEVVKEIFTFLYTVEEDLTFTENNIINLPLFRGIYLEGLDANYDDEFLNILNHIKNYKAYAKEVNLTHIKAELRDYQREGFAWLKTLYDNNLGGILADDMGLGKTIQTICLLSVIENVKALIVVPASLIYNWENEIYKFSSNLKVTLINGTKNLRPEQLQENSNVYITTYDILRRDIKLYKDVQFDLLIADEAQFIKNYDIQTAQAIRKINRSVTFALTGTPIENSLKELWSLFDFVLPSYLYSFTNFKKRYITPIQEENETISTLLRRQISPFILRRLKKEVLKDLPDKIEQNIYCDMSKTQNKIYYATHIGIIDNLEQEVEELQSRKEQAKNLEEFTEALVEEKRNEMSNNKNLLARITRLRQICNSPNLIYTKRADTKKDLYLKDSYEYAELNNINIDEIEEIESGKINALIDLLTQVKDNGSRGLVFSQFTSMLQLVIPKLEEKGFTFFYLDGKTKQQERFEQSRQFNQGERDFFLVSLHAGGTGLNLTGADVVVHIEPWWNPSVMQQATDRAHRYGQKKVIQVFNFITRDTIEEKIIELCEKKSLLAERVLTNDPSQFNLSNEDYRNLLTLSKDKLDNLKNNLK
ncbi:MAG: SNF2-related protein [Lachnospirales bacterium]